MRTKVLLDPFGRKLDEIFAAPDLQRLHGLADVLWAQDEAISAAEFAKIKDDLFAIITGRWRYGAVSELPKLHAILEVGGRHPSPKVLDYATCFARNIRVLSCAPAFGPMVAEMALGMALAASREIVAGHVAFSQGEEQWLHAGNVGTFTLYGQTVGLIGYGGLARCLKPLLAPFGCQLLAYDPWLPPTYLAGQGVEPVDLDTLLAKSQVIFVLAIPSTENKALLNRERLALIRPGAVFALVSRSHLVDFEALTEFVAAGRFRAAIDVFPQEPLPLDHPIRTAPGVVLSAHRAGSVTRDLRNIGRMVVDDLEAMLLGLPPLEMQVAQPEIVSRLE
ncbi:MAG TPA: NAD(P)-dependent oxidoreductase [Caldilineaceae bacterium]|nr:NAD(P)-dependent oxidoreductase [Caldilineaceae bacterium]